MSERYVAFLRAINVGGRRIKMDELRDLVEAAGFSNVESYRASGNVIFDATDEPADVAERLGRQLEDALEYEIPTFVRTLEDLDALLRSSPFEDVDDSTNTKDYIVFFGESLADEHEASLADLTNDVDSFRGSGRHVWWRRDMDAGESMATGELERALDLEGTRRTVGTVENIVSKYS